MTNNTYAFIAFIAIGILAAYGGIRLLNDKHTAFIFPPEKVLMDVFGGSKPENRLRILGRVRIVIGIFLIVIGIWALVA